MRRTWFAVVIALLFGAGPSNAAAPFDAEKFGELLALVKPRAEEQAWMQIPWEIDLWKARQTAARIGKPILLWEMDGNPLGCT